MALADYDEYMDFYEDELEEHKEPIWELGQVVGYWYPNGTVIEVEDTFTDDQHQNMLTGLISRGILASVVEEHVERSKQWLRKRLNKTQGRRP